MKRRNLFHLGLAAAALPVLPRYAASQPISGDTYPIGDFLLHHIGTQIRVSHRSNPDRVIWAPRSDGNFIVFESAAATATEVGNPEGTFEIVDKILTRYDGAIVGAITVSGNKAVITGTLAGGGAAYALTFEALSRTHLRFELVPTGTTPSQINRVQMNVESASDEAIFGCGSQLTFCNQKGKFVPILVMEHGIGRGKPIVTELVDLFDKNSGGNPSHTGVPVPYVITSRMRALFLESHEYSTFDMRSADAIEIKLWSDTMTGRILFGETPAALLEAYTEYAGRMRALPDWVHDGVILGFMGGGEVVRERLQKTKAAGVPISGLWLQDWVGTHRTSAGTQLWWNWLFDKTYYPNWQHLVDEVGANGGKILIYINPFLATTPGPDQLFQEAKARGYLVLRSDDTPYLIQNANFEVGMVDLSNPNTRAWIKNVMKNQMVPLEVGGWMLDFGEALPLDAKLYNGADPWVWHNKFPEEWQRISREAIDETGHGDDMLFFARSGYTQSPGISTLFWLGDQMMSWDEYDGIKTALVGILSGGISGFSLMHSDIGGYVNVRLDVAGKQIPIINRTPELLMRWMELNAFTAVMRTMDGLVPELAVQVDSNAETLAHFRRFGRIYQALAPYRKALELEASSQGLPLVRHLFLHYPEDTNTYDIRYQFLLGEDLLVAPALDKGVDTVNVYFPKGAVWIEAWSGDDVPHSGSCERMAAPLGKPALFIRKGSENADALAGYLKNAVGSN